MFFALLVAIVAAFAGGALADHKGRSTAGWFFGCFFMPLLLLIVAVLPANTEEMEARQLDSGKFKECPKCAEVIRREAVRCRYCASDLEIVDLRDVAIELSPAAPTHSPRLVLFLVLSFVVAMLVIDAYLR